MKDNYGTVRAVRRGISIAMNAFRHELKLSNEDYFRAKAVADDWFERSTGWSEKEFGEELTTRVMEKK